MILVILLVFEILEQLKVFTDLEINQMNSLNFHKSQNRYFITDKFLKV